MQQKLFLILNELCLNWLAFFGIITSRYFVICGATHLLCYSKVVNFYTNFCLPQKPPSWKIIKKDMELSVLCGIIFAFCGALVFIAYRLGFTFLYTSISKYGFWYLSISFVILLILQDTYFYFMHRLFHHPLLFKKLHSGHHRSKEPTPWTSFAFDPIEALIQGMFFVCIVFVLPLHYITLFTALIVMTIWAVFNHLGFEFFPSSFYSHWLGQWFIGSKHHLVHHRKYTLHYGLYFTFWDKILGTQDPNYNHNIPSNIN
ncbi:MAG: sterol desaturase family protein [Calothrix sp. MO_167.B42]|nr:sterol desaturase family protein [Calothrix sp. MO_167.B42]